MKLTFNYPGTKRAVITYAQNLSKIDGRVSLSKDFMSCIEKAAQDHGIFKNAVFYDPIQGVEKPVGQQIEDMEVPLKFDNYFPIQETSQDLLYGPSPLSQSNVLQNCPKIDPPVQQHCQYLQLNNSYDDMLANNPLDSPIQTHELHESPMLSSHMKKHHLNYSENIIPPIPAANHRG